MQRKRENWRENSFPLFHPSLHVTSPSQMPYKLPFSPKYFAPVVYCIVCWIFVIVDIVLPKKEALTSHGIIPRKGKGLVGIFAAPFVNSGVFMMITNTVGILIFGWLLLRRYIFYFIIIIYYQCIEKKKNIHFFYFLTSLS